MRIIAAALIGAMVAACTSPNTSVDPIQFGSSEGLVTSGNLRLVTERKRGPHYPPVVCTEPSPDYAIAFGTSGSVAVKVTPTQGTAVDGSGTFARTEQVTKLDGRNAAVLALRDGLYAACQSYANGAIGHDAYAMILSQYGALLVALVGDGDAAATGARRATSVGTPQATLSALVVACISQHDGTRVAPLQTENTLLTPSLCRQIVSGALRRSLRS